MTFDQAKTRFLATQREMGDLGSATALLYWDMQTVMPAKGADARARIAGALQTKIFLMMTDPAFGEAMQTLQQSPDALTARERRMVELLWRSYERQQKIPAAEFEAFSVLTAGASHLWMRAKQQNDYAAFAPHLQQIIDTTRRFADYYGYADKPYDALLTEYDPALLTAQIDPLFAELLKGTRALMQQIGEAPALPAVIVPPANQQAIGEYLLREMGYDLEAGNLFTTEHPFTTGIHAGDVRVTTKYHPEAPLSSIFSVLHEGGHGLYDQNIDPELEGTALHDGASMGIHESQSRFWENIVGRSRAFWQTRLAQVNKLAGVPLAPDAETFFRAINAVTPSLIRIEADELTYNLHIIIRYEIEKMIFNEGVNSADLPEIWADKYESYLGVRPKTYAEGVLQDSHWSGGAFAYFPSYTIGNLCGAQFAAAFEKQHGSLETAVSTPEGIAALVDWQKQNIHRFGAEQTPRQLMERVCGEDVNPQFFLKYMEKKLKAVYA
ncbi:MAG: carboxypeptidase M32 [Oscillospiraceae bacterium]|jgi:carboxypeptidase Taq|nr:carboxypeptidase M32 [Oscillospiraceae bacterium]